MESRRRAKIMRLGEKYSFNRIFRFLVLKGLAPGYAVIETTGRRTGRPRQVPVANGLRGDTFWVIAEQGRHADWVRNVETDPAVRVRVGRHWRRGAAELLPDDDWTARFDSCIPRWNEPFIRALGTDPFTVRIDLDLDPAPSFDGLWNHNIAYYGDVLDAMPHRCGPALDVGCGGGLLARAIAQRCERVIGIDSDHGSIEEARKLSTAHDNVELIEGDFLSETFGEATFDFIAMVASLHHMPLEAALAKARALLRPGGFLVVVGLARSSTLADFAQDVVGAVASRIVRIRPGWWEHSEPVADPEMTYTQVRRSATSVLPGSVFRRRIFFRYILTWARPV